MRRAEMKIKIKFWVLILVLLIILPSISQANAAEPPRITIVGTNLPKDLKISAVLVYEDGDTKEGEFQRSNKLWEDYFRLYSLGYFPKDIVEEYLVIETRGKTQKIEYPDSYKLYNQLYYLNLEDMTLSQETYMIRTYLLIALRVILTLIIEGVVLFAFGFREKRTYIAFLIVNILTQGILNYSFSGPNLSYIWWIMFLFLEFSVILIEILAFRTLIKEEGRVINFTIVANILSLIVGGLMISALPI